ncbi:hypothetical protein ACFVVX_11205 [Kitasatospora sp. NPDC058170]|uniref:hypothetical protein n=1 Tax=Kitasatospora sp. NPDC058170 TaxID=3346364 RepID=UPI0036DD1E5E
MSRQLFQRPFRRPFQKSLRRAVLVAGAAAVLAAGPAAAGAPCGADLAVTAANPAPTAGGGSTTVHPVVVNTGDAATTAPFTLVVQLPPGVVGVGQAPSACSTGPFGHTVTCTFPAGLAPGGTVAADVRLSVATGMDPGVLDGTVAVDLPGDPTPADNSAHFDIVVVP